MSVVQYCRYNKHISPRKGLAGQMFSKVLQEDCHTYNCVSTPFNKTVTGLTLIKAVNLGSTIFSEYFSKKLVLLLFISQVECFA